MSKFKPAPWPRKLRSQEWFAGTSKDAIYHRSWMKNQGLPADLFDGRPVIGILNTFSELNPCNAHLNDLAERVNAVSGDLDAVTRSVAASTTPGVDQVQQSFTGPSCGHFESFKFLKRSPGNPS